jgi:hypothetical protein
MSKNGTWSFPVSGNEICDFLCSELSLNTAFSIIADYTKVNATTTEAKLRYKINSYE